MRTLIMVVAILIIGPFANAQPVYKTVDEEGRVSYSDKPPRNDKKASSEELPTVNTVPGEQISPSSRSTPGEEAEEETVRYSVDLLSPLPQTSVPPGQRDLPISITMDPNLQAGHVVVYYLDGDVLTESRSLQHLVPEIHRGTHTVQVEIIDTEGRVLGASESVTFHVHRPSVINRPGR